jgi:hypothetical protein
MDIKNVLSAAQSLQEKARLVYAMNASSVQIVASDWKK